MLVRFFDTLASLLACFVLLAAILLLAGTP